MRILQDAQEVSLAQTLAVAAEQLAGSGANHTRARRPVLANRAANEIECILACEAKPARSDLVNTCGRSSGPSRLARGHGFRLGGRVSLDGRDARPTSSSIPIAPSSPS